MIAFMLERGVPVDSVVEDARETAALKAAVGDTITIDTVRALAGAQADGSPDSTLFDPSAIRAGLHRALAADGGAVVTSRPSSSSNSLRNTPASILPAFRPISSFARVRAC